MSTPMEPPAAAADASPDSSTAPTLVAPPPVERRLAPFTPGSLLGNRYRIVSLIGRGGMGEVYRADDLRLGHPVALKFLPAELAGDPDRQARLFEEVRLGRQVSHPNVCRIHDIVEIGADRFISMEYVDGENLDSLVRRVGRLAPERARSIAIDLCAGLAAAHDRGVIHRDLKPANVMLDGRGRAKITDFGIAVGREHGGAAPVAGTPGFMAPEMLTGAPASAATDVYALGATLYHVFTGRPPWEGATANELWVRQASGPPPSPSAITRDVDPDMEATILSCLDPDPGRRPASADAIFRSIPGADPLAAAVRAGETPSPAMVEAAREVGALTPLHAWASLAFVFAGIVGVALLAYRTMLFQRLPMSKAPAVLDARAGEILATAGYRAAPHRASTVFVARNESPLFFEDRRDLPSRPPTRIRFAFRTSPRPLFANNWEYRVFLDDPAHAVSGMTTVVLDSEGRLTELIVVPPQREAGAAAEREWSELLGATGVEVASLRPVAPEWAAPVDSDAKRAWLGKYPEGANVRIEAASYHGRPVWLAAIPPGTAPTRMRSFWSPGDRIAVSMNVFFFVAIPAVVFFLARRNLRRGVGDRRGAMRVGFFMFGVTAVSGIVRAQHGTIALTELALLGRILAQGALFAIATWGAYIAVEPFVRRRWPEILIGWARLLAGRARDPMVGRDTLAGAAAGVAMTVLWHLTALPWPPVPGARIEALQLAATTLGDLRHVVFYLVFSIGESIGRILAALALIVMIRAVVRSDRYTAMLFTVLLAASLLGDSSGDLFVRAVFFLAIAALSTWVLMRLGVLTLVVAGYFILVLRSIPITLDPSDWFFGRSAVALAVLAAITLYGFSTAAGRTAFSGRWLDEA